MATKDPESEARALAKQLLDDVELYNREKIAAGVDIGSDIAEARSLYQERVDPKYHQLFEWYLRDRPLARPPTASAVAAQASARKNVPVLAIALLLVALGAGMWFAMRGF